MNLSHYPNLEAVLQGRVSGQATEWPAVRAELRTLIKQRDRLEAALRDAKAQIDYINRYSDVAGYPSVVATLSRINAVLAELDREHFGG